MSAVTSGPTIYHGDDIRPMLKNYKPVAQSVPSGTDVKDVLFDGYPQIVKEEGSQPIYSVKVQKDIMVPMRDGVRLAVDVYRPDAEGEQFPAILAFASWGKELQETARWLPEQDYYDTPFWDGCIEAGAIDYFVTRGYIRVIPEPRNMGKSEGTTPGTTRDIYDVIEWIAKQPWCDGNVGMLGACAYAGNQLGLAADDPPPALKAIVPWENILGTGEQFHGIYDCMHMNIRTARHGNDSLAPALHKTEPPAMLSLHAEELEARVQEALNHPDIKYNGRFYSIIKYPLSYPTVFDSLLASFHPTPARPAFDSNRSSPLQPIPESKLRNVTIPTHLSTPWNELLYTWQTFEAWRGIASSNSSNKKLALWPSKAPGRPFVAYSDEAARFYDYWLKGIDTGIMDEPPIKLFVMGINKWRFENEWPLERTEWTKFYLQPGGGLSADPVEGKPDPDTFTQPAPYLDPTVYCLTYTTEELKQDTEITGPIALYLEASIDKDDTNWMVNLVDVDAEGNKTLVTTGYLKAQHRAVDETKSEPYRPVHPRQDPVPVPPGEVIKYPIVLMPSSNVFKKGHHIQLLIRNQDDLLSKLGIWGVYMLPFMQTVKHDIHFGESHLLLPLIPANNKEVG